MIRLLVVLAAVIVGVLALAGYTPVVPQSLAVAGFFIGGPVTLVWRGCTRKTVQS